MASQDTRKDIGPRTDPETQRRAISERDRSAHPATEDTQQTILPEKRKEGEAPSPEKRVEPAKPGQR